MKCFRGSIRRKLFFLVLFATTPVLCVHLGTELINRKNVIAEARKGAELHLHGIIAIQQRITESTRTLLHTLASIPCIRDGDEKNTQKILETILKSNPVYTNIVLINLEGDVITAGKHHEKIKKLNFSDRKVVTETIVHQEFSVGEFNSGKFTRKPVFPFAIPVLDQEGNMSSILLIGVSLDYYQNLFEGADYPVDAAFGICDSNGTRLFRYPSRKNIQIGTPITPKIYNAAKNKQQPGTLTAVAADNKKRIIAYQPLRLSNNHKPYMYMFMTFQYDKVMKQTSGLFFRLIFTSIFSIGLALTIAWFLGNYTIADKLEKLTKKTRNFSLGNDDIVSGLDYQDGEIGALASSFDSMVKELQRNEKTRDLTLKQLQISEEKFRMLIESVAGIAIQGYDQQRRVTFWNGASEKLYGYSYEEAIGKKLEDLILPESMRETAIRDIENWIRKGKKVEDGELVLVDKYGNNVPVYSSHVLSSNTDGVEMFCIDVDLRQLKQSEADKKELLTQLQQAKKLEAIGTLAGGIAHDFNNILVPIIGFADVLIYKLAKDKPEYVDDLKHIKKSGIRAKELVQQILTFSRQEAVSYQRVRIQSLVKEIIKLLQPTLPSNILLHCTVEEKCPPIKGDLAQLHRVVMNLVTNSSQAIGKNDGELTVSLRCSRVDDITAREVGIKPGKWVLLAVADTGKGMSSEIIDKIFDPFFTTQVKSKGTGMGLAMVHGIVETMGGTINVKSELEKGTTFTIYFPALIEAESVVPMETISTLQKAKGEKEILLIDDEESNLAVNRQALEALGYRVHTQERPLSAIEYFAKNQNKIDLVITDMEMPLMTGDRLAEEILKIRAEVPIILCTGFSEKLTPERIKDLGIREVIMKPTLIGELSKKISQILS